jgi:hypothetical protein
MTTIESNATDKAEREPVLNPVDRVSELLFGLFMALTFVGAVSVAEGGREELRMMFAAALGCNLARRRGSRGSRRTSGRSVSRCRCQRRARRSACRSGAGSSGC